MIKAAEEATLRKTEEKTRYDEVRNQQKTLMQNINESINNEATKK